MGLVRLLHVSDTHLGAVPYGLPERERDLYDAFREVVDIAIGRGVNAVIHGGDLFHSSRPKPRTLIMVVRELMRLKDAGIEFIVAPGNHELPKGEHVGSPVRLLEVLGLARSSHGFDRPDVHGLGGVDVIVFSEWSSGLLAKLDPSSLSPSHVRIALAHVPLCDALLQVESVPETSCPSRVYSSLIRRGYSYVALGDIHTRWVGSLEDGTPIVYPGSTEYLGVDEYRRDPERSVYIVDVEGPGEVKLERVRLKSTRPWILVEGEAGNVYKAVQDIRKIGDKEPLVIVRVKGGISRLARNKLVSALEGLRRSNTILYYSVEVEEGKLFPRPPQQQGQARVSVESVIRDIVKCDEAVNLVKSIIEDPKLAEKFIDELERDENIVKCLENSKASTRRLRSP
ncbi:MAG: exonuclease SbcCD subunit D [Thermoprotei archaeon]|nr:exonuclease SbcCD subunit D [Thermoprotei archaeon]